MSVVDRFLRYVQIDTRADESSTTCPSTPGQLTLQELLAGELREMGVSDVTLDDNGYLMATIPATVAHETPVIGLIAHVDTSPEMSGAHVKPIVHRAWDGRDIVLPDDDFTDLPEDAITYDVKPLHALLQIVRAQVACNCGAHTV